ncbi:helix-turn-helix transcriptional regulator [Dongia deserti]|uniref:helix-turn-helix transcriptional regulator n=1 Tax=Dongia deserti TaxID=2268030 RepID=UPI000E64E0F9|nr:helix-turn-helix transcriptional regulator [Dongia deserti]
MLNALPQWQTAEGALRRFVLGFWQGGRPAEDDETFRILPDGSLDLVWALGISAPRSIAFGTTTRPRDVALIAATVYCGVRFRPGTAHRFLDHVDLSQFTDRDAPCLLRGDRDLAWRLADAHSFEDRAALIARHLNHLSAGHDVPDLGEAAARMIGAHGGQLRIGDLAAKLGVTRRHLERQCRRDLGTSPKMLTRITRFRRAAALLSRGRVRSGADLAAAGGYVDQAHLIREFREFAGTTPKMFRP